MNWSLIEEILEKKQSVDLQVKGTSMYPSLFTGDRVRIEPIEEDVCLKDIVLIKTKDQQYYLHRIIELEPQLVVKGDNIQEVDKDIEKMIGIVKDHRKTAIGLLKRLKYFLMS